MRIFSYLKFCLMLAALLLPGVGRAAGLLTPADGSLPALEIKQHQVKVVIEDGYARIRAKAGSP